MLISYNYSCLCVFFFEFCGDHLDLHVLTHSFPTRRSSDLVEEDRKVSADDGRDFAEQQNIEFIETSSKEPTAVRRLRCPFSRFSLFYVLRFVRLSFCLRLMSVSQ